MKWLSKLIFGENDGKDLCGVKYAKVKDVKAGDQLRADECFSCMADGDIKEVMMDHYGALYIKCAEGHHDLDSQCESPRFGSDYYLGLYPVGKS